MRKLFYLASFLFLLISQGHAAVTATTVWEFRTDAGDLNNGSCFDGSVAVPGTDYSFPQASSQYNGTDLVIDGVDNTKVTSATHNFVAADEGNCVRVSAGTGFTVGWYVITDTSANAATLSSAVGTTGSTGGTYRVGGAALLNSTNADDYFEAMVAGNTGWFLYNASAHAVGEAVSVVADATSTTVISINGYNTTRGDNPTGANRPVIDIAAQSFTMTGDYFNFSNLIFTVTSATGFTSGIGSVFRNVKITNSSVTAGRPALSINTAGKVFDSEFISTNGNAITGNGSNAIFHGNYIHDSVTCLNMPGNDFNVVSFNSIDTCSTAGIALGSASESNKFLFNTIYGAETPAGTGMSAAATQSTNTTLIGNIFYGWVTGISFNANVQSTFADYNDFFNNTTNRQFIDAGPNDLGVDPAFTNAASGDFSIGTALKAAGFPGAFQGATSTGYLDVGAVQRQEPAGGSGGSFTFVQ